MPSYLEREQITPTQPHMDNIQSVLGVYNAKLQYWAAGASQINNAYQNYLGYDLTHPGDQEQLKKLMLTAQGIVRKSAQTDLSVGDNISAAMKAFDPILKDRDIAGDHMLTTQIKDELAKADADRTADGGKNFNQSRYGYLNGVLSAYASDDDKSSWKDYASLGAKYVPYYDKLQEIKTLEGMFKTDVIKTFSTAHPGYIYTRTNSSWVKNKWQAFVQANASDKLKTQLAGESANDLLVNLQANKGKLGEVYDFYNGQFKAMHQQQVDEYTEALNEATMNLKGLNKNTIDYDNKKKEYEDTITEAGKYIKELTDVTNPSNTLSRDIVNPKAIYSALQSAISLGQHKYFDKIGSAFATKIVDENLSMDHAYFATQTLLDKQADRKEDHYQFNTQLAFNEKKLTQEGDLERLRIRTSLIIAGKDANGNPLAPASTLYPTPLVNDPSATSNKQAGNNLMDAYNTTLQKNSADLFDNTLGPFVGSRDWLTKVKAAGDTRLIDVRSFGAQGKEQSDKLVSLIADALYDPRSPVYAEYKIKTEGVDPKEAKESFKKALLESASSKVVALAYKVLGDEKGFKHVLNYIQSQPNGDKLKADLEMARDTNQSVADSYNEAFAPAVSKMLTRDWGWQTYYGHDTEEYKQGIRGTEQEMNKYTMPSDAQMKAFIRIRNRHKAVAYQSNTVGGPLGAQGKTWETPATSATNDDGLQDMKDQVYEEVGNIASVRFNVLAGSVTVDDKNRDQTNTLINSILAGIEGNAGSDEKELASIVKKYISSVHVITTYGTTVDGKASVGFQFDAAKLKAAGVSLPSGYENMRLSTTSPLVDARFKNNDPSYAEIMTRGKSMEVDFNIKGTANGGKAGIKVFNSEGGSLPEIKIEGSYFLPAYDKVTGAILYDSEGKLVLNRIEPQAVNEFMNAEMGGGDALQQNLLKNPNKIYMTLAYFSKKWKAYIEEIVKTRPAKLTDISEARRKELEKIKPSF